MMEMLLFLLVVGVFYGSWLIFGAIAACMLSSRISRDEEMERIHIDAQDGQDKSEIASLRRESTGGSQ